ncbi:PLP-dependent aminotransferase family protein [Methylosinus sp. Sm6]|uniref:MocR-like pyridoxine biosynthesis transcription factor PdxR n=1 Tax=Methylosinus sp. Sm6 TaxID=2866948 RepID=UPI001C999A1F|nr:PLP-dependent aminotransferase family protein [Methylosinus sp. Sm6]MBY6242282.1 PLP-dependent aminotransferase family protein [Methylosinus sp. Sm6]
MRRAREVELALGPRPDGVSLQHWLYSEIRAAILSRRLQGGARLPASRDLARRAGVSRGTVLAALEQLAAEGYLVAVVGRGASVAADLPDQAPEPPPSSRPAAASTGARLAARGLALIEETPFPVAAPSWPLPAFRPNQPDVAAFPLDLWRRSAARRSRLTRVDLLADGEAQGYGPLREAVAAHLRQSRGIACEKGQVAIVASVQQALDLLARLCLDPGDAVWMEDPGFPGARLVLAAAGARIVGVPVDSCGLDVTAGRRLAPNARMAYVTAGRQAPLGMPLALDRRLELLAWAEAAEAIVVEDDYDSEFRFRGLPLAALKSHDSGDRVAYVGAFSKMLFPALRLAFVALPGALVDPFAKALSLTCRYQPTAAQATLFDFIAEGHLGRHIRRMRLLYAERAEALRDAASRRLGGALVIPPILMGLDTPAFLAERRDGAAIVRRAAERGVEVRDLSYYAVDRPAPAGVQLGFAALAPAAIDEGMARLAQALEEVR